MLAFSSSTLQRFGAWIDDLLFGLLHCKKQELPPIFITSLARGATTAVLNAFSDLPSIATHSYRDMPFITAPYIWSKMSALFRRDVKRIKRAHGDGLEIDLNSAEAFDEVYWMLYWPEKYRNGTIATWDASDNNTAVISAMRNCFRKITHIRRDGEAHYVSKNNANIARLRFIPEAFPEASIVIPIRRPAPHAASLMRQHKNFLEQHSRDDFIRRYMRDIGHLEFGLLHHAIGFEGFKHPQLTPNSPDYWLEYWIAAFRDVRANLDHCHVVLQEDLRSEPDACMHRLLDKLGVDANDRDFSGYFRSGPDETNTSVFSDELLAKANSLYNEIAYISKI